MTRKAYNQEKWTSLRWLAPAIGIAVLGLWLAQKPVSARLKSSKFSEGPDSEIGPIEASRQNLFQHPLLDSGLAVASKLGTSDDTDSSAVDSIAPGTERSITSKDWIPFAVNDRWGYQTPDGTTVIEPQFDEAWAFSDGRAVVKVDDAFGFIDESGRWVIPPTLDNALGFRGDQAVVSVDGKSRFIDRNGNPLSDNQFDRVWPPDEGSQVYMVKVGDKYGYVDQRGEYVVQPIIEETFGFQEGMSVIKVGGRYGYIDEAGRILIDAKYDYAWPFKNEEALVSLNGENWIINPQGRILRQH